MRREQFIAVKTVISELLPLKKNIKGMSFKKLKDTLVKGEYVPDGISPERFTAMVKSFLDEGTLDEDVIWHSR